jgi:hypothetical protein
MESGTRLGPYEIDEQLGAGGMGEVYLARDTRLGRKVAIKVLPEEYSSDPERLARFEQEARAAAALNHPHIAAVHDVGESDGTHFIVQEYLEGQTLRELMRDSPPRLERALAIGSEIAAALATAHRAGIVHRDIKPDNIFVTATGHTKVLDFGLAKLTEASGFAGGDATMSPTALGTMAGAVMGTVGYMAPEQVEAGEVDGRADVFALGCVLYELTGGRRPFEGENVHTTLGLILSAEPEPVSFLRPGLPRQLEWVLDKCLAKDPARRYQHADDLAVDLMGLERDVESGRVATAPVPGREDRTAQRGVTPSVAMALAAMAVLVVLSTWWGATRPAGGPGPVRRFDVLLSEQPGDVVLADENGSSIVIAPDASRLVWVGDGPRGVMLYTRRIDSDGRQPIPGTEGADMPFFSPDSRTVGFFAGARLLSVGFGGAPPVELAETGPNVRGGDWRVDGTIAIGNADDVLPGATGLQILSPDGELRSVTEVPRGTSQRYPQFLPGNRVLLTIEAPGAGASSAKTLAVYSLETGSLDVLQQQGSYARYLSSGHLVFGRGQSLVAVQFDLDTLEAVGEEVVVIENLHVEPNIGFAHFTVADDGTLVYAPTRSSDGQLAWVQPDGTFEAIHPEPRKVRVPRLSPDGTRVALWVVEREAELIEILDLRTGGLQSLTSGGEEFSPAWMPDGEEVLFGAREPSGTLDLTIFRVATGFTADPVPFAEVSAYSWDQMSPHPDGDGVAITRYDGNRSIFLLRDGASEFELLASSPGASNWAPAFSPDGRWLAFVSDENGRPQVYVLEYPDAALKRVVSLDGGKAPVWSRDGTEIYFLEGRKMMAATFDSGTGGSDTPRELFENLSLPGMYGAANYDVAADGSFLMVLGDESTITTSVKVVLNWFGELNRLVPSGQ